ncbi:transposase, partial [Limosilactobacillus mucosae]|uniref:transposase n=1 Tax=Limosilactobacillus mucosae TaxID=97478 RepID=UPI0022AA90B9
LDFSVAPTNGEAWRELLEVYAIEELNRFSYSSPMVYWARNVIAEIYPNAKFQRCLVHVLRNLTSHVRKAICEI